jgi:hypothetical protein
MADSVRGLVGVTPADIREIAPLIAALQVAKVIVASLTLELPTTAATLKHEPALFMCLRPIVPCPIAFGREAFVGASELTTVPVCSCFMIPAKQVLISRGE